MRCRLAVPLAILSAVLCLPRDVAAQSKRVEDLAVGKLLVSPRDSPDPTFASSVILLIQFDEDATVGLIINHRSKVPISRALHQLKGADNRADPVYVGGPVNLAAVFALLRAGSKPEDAKRVLGNVYLLSSRPLLEKTLTAGTGAADFHTFVGYCGWSPGQLENEMNLGVWYIFNGDANMVFDSDPDTLWSRLIARTEQRFAQGFGPRMLANTHE
jgi:putative transcriptional regulator